ncbi:MAG: type II toxin-antitoxin system RelE/ParE family toxin [Eubacteriales bacterium]|nr:type II toxin-antitoxin system RelE/ParE family toxin [Eubacteriales bacterium]
MTREFVRMPVFEKKWQNAGLTEDELAELEYTLCQDPLYGATIMGTGGLRKIRWALPNRGKRGGVRVLYVDFAFYKKIYLISAYTKGEKDNLSKGECNNIKALISQLENVLRGG